MKILFAVITCNRLYYLKNCVKSILEFVGLNNIELMILDNNTIEKGTEKYLNNLSEVAMIKRFHNRVPNELYRAMNYAIRYCMKNKIAIINFIQDDYQFLYKLDSMLPTIRLCFKKFPKVGQINYNMAWKRKKISRYSTLTAGNTHFAILDKKNLVDNGFTRVSLYKKTGLYSSGMISYDQNSEKTFGFGKNRYSKKRPNGEIWFGRNCRRMGYVRLVSLMPNQGMLFDCAYVRKWNLFGNYFPPPHKYYLKPFTEDDIKIVENKHKKKKFCFIEKMAIPWGWKPTTHDKHNRQNIKRSILDEKND